jgi:hypothetical protein
MLHVARFSLHCVSALGSGEARIAAGLRGMLSPLP